MANFMTNYRTNTTVVNSVVGIHVEEWRLQNTRREHNFIRRWAVVSVYCLRRHTPARTIYWLTEVCNIFVVTKVGQTNGIANQVVCRNLQRRVILPFVWVANFRRKVSEFFQRLYFGVVRHPLEFVDRLFHSFKQVINQLTHTRFCFWREVTCYVFLPQYFA